MFSRRSREERERQAGRPRGVSTSGVCRLSMMKQRHACVVSWKIQTKRKKKRRGTRAAMCIEIPRWALARSARERIPRTPCFLFYSLALSLSPPRNNRRCSFFLRVCVVLSSKCRYISARKKKERVFVVLCGSQALVKWSVFIVVVCLCKTTVWVCF